MSEPFLLHGTNLVRYPFPLRDDVTAALVLPLDLTRAEVDRLTRFLETLVAHE